MIDAAENTKRKKETDKAAHEAALLAMRNRKRRDVFAEFEPRKGGK
jgi:hypothetical protein